MNLGMGNRFFSLVGYQGLVKAHGILAAITFLLVIPAAILTMRFYGRNPRQAVRSHIWLQILSLFLATAVFIIGWFQVGPRRSLTNPHHGIGVALYVLLWVQVIGGSVIHRIERTRRRFHVPLKAMLHHWLGRAIALLGIAQIALGLTLYGSPLYLFVLYALWVALLIVVYFVLQWRHERRRAQIAPGQSEYSEEVITEQRPAGGSHAGFGKIAAAGAAGAGLAALFGRRQKPKRRYSESDATWSSSSSSSYLQNEKPVANKERAGFGKRLLQVGAIGGGLAAAKSIFSRKKSNIRDDDSDYGPYPRPVGGDTSVMSDSVSRLEEGRPPRPVTPTGYAAASGARPAHPLAQPPMNAASALGSEEYSYYEYESSSPSRQGRHQTFKQAVAAGGAMYAVRSLFKNRKDKKEAQRADELRRQRIEQERIARMNSKHRYTGDGAAPPTRPRHNRLASQTASDISSVMPGVVQRPGVMSAVSSLGAPIAGGASAAAVSALADRNQIRPVGNDPVVAPPGPASAIQSTVPFSTDVPPLPPPHGTEMLSSGSELYTTASGRQRHRHHIPSTAGAAAGAALVGTAAGAAAADARRRRTEAQNTDSMESPPVSIHVKTQDNGRKVTLRRLTEEEAAAQRAARRQERRNSRRRRNSSLSSSGGEGWRRTEQIEAQQQAQMDAAAAAASSTPRPSTINLVQPAFPTPPIPGTQPMPPRASAISQGFDPHTGSSYTIPLPPPIPASTSNLGPAGSITSPGTEGSTGASEYANNRKRRRAERAQARIAREGKGGNQNTVDFT